MATTRYQRDAVSQIDNQILARAAFNLDDRQRKVFSQRLIRRAPKTLQQLANELGVSKERVRQIQSRAFERVSRFIDGETPIGKD